jgi:hypothetical protein
MDNGAGWPESSAVRSHFVGAPSAHSLCDCNFELCNDLVAEELFDCGFEGSDGLVAEELFDCGFELFDDLVAEELFV